MRGDPFWRPRPIWLQKQKSARTRRAYRLDVQHFLRTLDIATGAELRQADQLRTSDGKKDDLLTLAK